MRIRRLRGLTAPSGKAYRLTWSAGEMLDGGDITITAANVADTVGNPIGASNSATNVGGAIGSAPTVTAVRINRGSVNRSEVREISVQFSEDVSATLDAGDLTLYDQTNGLPVNVAAATVSYDAGTNTATWDLAAVTLADAYYQATLSAAGIADPAGNLLDGDGDGSGGGDRVFQFHKLAGDANGDAKVGVGDLGLLGASYNTTGNWWELAGDMDLNGTVSIGDLGLLGANYGTE